MSGLETATPWERLVRAYEDLMRRELESPPEQTEVSARLRAKAEPVAGYTAPHAVVRDEAVPGPHGHIPIRIYRAADATAAGPVLVWCHGGAFVGGDLDMPEADATAREVATRAGAVVISVDYRLATNGVHFPVPHDDAHAVFRWARANAEALGSTPERVHLGGASAGANLAAGVTLRLRDEQGEPPASVVLAYPLVHAELPRPSAELAAKLALLPDTEAFQDDAVNRILVENYLGGPVEQASPYAFAGLGELAGYPRTFMVNCEYDRLRSSGEDFAARLRAAGVEVELSLARDVLHGHLNAPHLAEAQRSYADIAAWLVR